MSKYPSNKSVMCVKNICIFQEYFLDTDRNALWYDRPVSRKVILRFHTNKLFWELCYTFIHWYYTIIWLQYALQSIQKDYRVWILSYTNYVPCVWLNNKALWEVTTMANHSMCTFKLKQLKLFLCWMSRSEFRPIRFYFYIRKTGANRILFLYSFTYVPLNFPTF
jgi:hypothetical protein